MGPFGTAPARRPGRFYGHGILRCLAAVAVAAGIAWLGGYANPGWVTPTGSSVPVLVLGGTGSSTSRLSVSASGLAPGDAVQRSVDLVNSGSDNFAAIVLTTTASPTSLLDSDTEGGIQIVIDRCSVPWVEAASTPGFTYTCSGRTSIVLARRAVIGSNLALANLTATTAGTTDHLQVTLTLSGTAGNSFQGLTSAIAYAFAATSMTGASHT